MANLLDILLEAPKKKCHCSEKTIKKMLSGVKASIIDFCETETQFTVTVELNKGKLERLVKAVDDEFPEHIKTVSACGEKQAFLIIWKV